MVASYDVPITPPREFATRKLWTRFHPDRSDEMWGIEHVDPPADLRYQVNRDPLPGARTTAASPTSSAGTPKDMTDGPTGSVAEMVGALRHTGGDSGGTALDADEPPDWSHDSQDGGT